MTRYGVHCVTYDYVEVDADTEAEAEYMATDKLERAQSPRSALEWHAQEIEEVDA